MPVGKPGGPGLPRSEVMARRVVIALVVCLVSAPIAHFARGWPWQLAGIAGVLLGGLAFVTLQTIVRLRATLSQFQKR